MRKQLAVRIEEEELKEIRIELVKEGKNFQEYVMELIRKDMDSKRGGK